MIDITLLSLFIPTFFIVSLTPGMCMTLAMSLGITIGVRKTLWMMYGELLGVATVAVASVLGVATIMTKFPELFQAFKIMGALYLLYVGINMCRAKGKLLTNSNQQQVIKKRSLFQQGFFTAIANPKGWAFMISLLPPFISQSLPLAPQLSILVAVILISEFVCMTLYATGGKTLGKLLTQRNNVQLLNRISGCLMILVAIWLAMS
ncbi:LysE family translocator [Colwellia sp. MB3u-70]|uniref:LysE family translocator n=1 Tax=unclassified Colwellia TaxID=196834 RepID=UPI0015F455A1|nr:MULTISPECIES: LysE family translocator [unclassified Colwellia]MBA6291446.1 LysE family translocator [Colwellia sp. MB3u-8]MBA6308320.1 LysE family translocator [Colwellia sp. MB3u-70]